MCGFFADGPVAQLIDLDQLRLPVLLVGLAQPIFALDVLFVAEGSAANGLLPEGLTMLVKGFLGQDVLAHQEVEEGAGLEQVKTTVDASGASTVANRSTKGVEC